MLHISDKEEGQILGDTEWGRGAIYVVLEWVKKAHILQEEK
jgi:hypothetical protein